jgi:hypothetical protein
MAENRARSPSVPFTIPPDSPLAVGWRATLAELLLRHGVPDVLDALAAFAELRCRHDPDRHDDPWVAAPAVRRIEAVAGNPTSRGRSPKLSARQRRILEVMRKAHITDESSRRTHRDIVHRIDPKANIGTWHFNFSVLHRLGLIESVRGKDGGVWLSAKAVE